MPSWLAITADGTARRIGALGLVIGRAPTCDVIVEHAEVSRRHVLLQLGMRGQLDIVPLPGAPTSVNGVALLVPAVARDGDRLSFPGGATIRLAIDDAGVERDVAWLLDVGGRRIGLRADVVKLGGGRDDIVIEGWPPSLARLVWRGDALVIQADAAGLLHNNVELALDREITLQPSDRLAFGDRAVTIVTEVREPEPTLRDADRDRIRAIELEMLPSGGMITLVSASREHRVMLAERRFALAMILLVPPLPLRAGELVPDEVVFAAVWPRNQTVDRGDLNQLVFRLRNDLNAAGLSGSTLIDRFAKGGATRFVVEPGTSIASVS